MMFWNRNKEVNEVKEVKNMEEFIREQERLNENLRKLHEAFATESDTFTQWYKRELAKAAR